jgi:hypothetical protein
MLYRVHLAWVGFELTTLVVIGTDCIGSYKSNYHTIMTTAAPQKSKDNVWYHTCHLIIDIMCVKDEKENLQIID